MPNLCLVFVNSMISRFDDRLDLVPSDVVMSLISTPDLWPWMGEVCEMEKNSDFGVL